MYKKTFNKPGTKPIKEKSTQNIKDFLVYKVLHTLTKPHSPHTIVFIEDLNDPWLVYVKTFKTKVGTITNSSMIIACDVSTWVGHLIRLGHELKK